MWGLVFLLSISFLFVLPLIPALHEWRRKGDAAPLGINPADKADTRFHAGKFRTLIESRESEFDGSYGGKRHQQSHNNGGKFQLEKLLRHWREIRRLVSTGPLKLPSHQDLDYDIYAKADVICGRSSRLHGILAEANLLLESGCTLRRWAHARTVSVGNEGVLLGTVSADEMIFLDIGCRFGRINAATICFGKSSGASSQSVGMSVNDTVFAPDEPGWISELMDSGRLLVDDDLDFSPQAPFHGDLVVRGNMTLRSGSRILGSVKCYGNMRIEQNSSVMGALVSQQSVNIGSDCEVAGPVVAEEEIEIESGSVIGSLKCPTSVTAPSIRVMSNVAVHGTVWARIEGTVIPLPIAEAVVEDE